MRLVRMSRTPVAELTSTQFQNERELEDAVVACPRLLLYDDDAPIAFVQSQVRLPETGSLDLLLVDASCLPIVAEAKLARNGESRREIIGQVVDYVSTLTSMTVDELDQTVKGALETAIRSLIDPSDSTGRFEELWQLVGSNLRSGLARYVIVVDTAPPELERIVRFLAARSSLDISLVSITKYRDTDGGTVLASHHLVRPVFAEGLPARNVRETPGDLQAAVDAYDASAAENWLTQGRSAGYRQIHPPGWPGGLHYEFMHRAGGPSVELHIESDLPAPGRRVLSSRAKLRGILDGRSGGAD
jgi:hypothetical protein